uniref:SSD domain-containing protein n=1 Tax=Candidatus Kentrum sp. MB TaxID=2138164 RepID=A0A450XQN0_9GAMM|nr:MAG: hypothetical protein BECKMB1821G_GA0114241_102235 [Candidatus Kentron sp. MB]VFK31576.1 MAG: hypothetical protein BECKMB1821I_GA0114274_10257 [Candidatus Kentron sp. MB]VFK75890.1 MAG: hypothetical protein BECKMB1821H_GA0114242_103431 [Candidatus Kentron sp. MB]
MLERYSHWLIRWRYLVLLATLALVCLATLGFPLKFDADYRVFFDEDNPELLAFDDLKNTYTAGDDNVLLVVAPGNGRVFTRETLSALEWLTKEAWQTPYSIRVDSITNFQHSYANGDDIIVGDLIPSARALSNADLARVRRIALSEPLLRNNLISPTAHVTGINIIFQLPGLQLDREVPEVVAFVRDLQRRFLVDYPHMEVHLTGNVIFNNAFPEISKRDMGTLIPVMFLLILVTLWLLLRSLSGVFAAVLLVVLSTTVAMGLAGLMGISLTGVSNVAPIVILTVAIADAVHILTTLQLSLDGRTKHAAIVEALRLNFQPVFLTSLTTAIGFLSLNFGNSPPFHDLGNIVAMGVMAAFFLSVTLLPALMAILPAPPGATPTNMAHVMGRLGAFVVQRRRVLLWATAGIALLLMAFLPRNELNNAFLEYFDERFDFRIATDFATDNLTGPYKIHYNLDSGEPNGIHNPEFLGKVTAFADWYRTQPEVIHVDSIVDTLKRLNRNLHGDDPAWYRLPEERALAAQYLLLYEMSLPYGLDLNNQINLDKSATRLTISLGQLSDKELLALEARAKRWLSENAPPSMQVPGTGSTMMFAWLNLRNLKGLLLGALFALILISMVLMFALGSARLGLISLIPNLLPVIMAFGIWGILVGEVNLGLSGVALITIGIVVDDTVHFLSKYLRFRREQGLAPPDAVHQTFRSVGVALWVTSFVLVAGFSVLALSDFRLNADMGIMTALTVALALMTDFFLLPPLLMKLDKLDTMRS